MARQEGRVQRQPQCVPVGHAADEAYAQCASSTGLPSAWGSYTATQPQSQPQSQSQSASASSPSRPRRSRCQGQQQFNLLSRSCLCLRTCYLAISLTANPQWGRSVGEGSGEASNSMPAQIQRMLYTSGRPTWGRRANRAHISHWSLTFSANCEGWQSTGSVSNKGCTVGGGKCNNFLLRLINWSASASLSASRCDARRDSAKSVLSTSSDLPLYFAIILAIIFVIIYV